MATGEVSAASAHRTRPWLQPADLRAGDLAGRRRLAARRDKVCITTLRHRRCRRLGIWPGRAGLARLVSAFLVPTAAEGLTANPPSRRGSGSLRTPPSLLDGVEVGPEAWRWQATVTVLRWPPSALDDGDVDASSTGVGQSALDSMLAHAGAREQFGKPIARSPAGIVDSPGRRRRRVPAADRAVAGPAKTRGRCWRPEGQAACDRGVGVGWRTPASRCTAATGTVDAIPAAKYLRDARVTTPNEGDQPDPEAADRPRPDRPRPPSDSLPPPPPRYSRNDHGLAVDHFPDVANCWSGAGRLL